MTLFDKDFTAIDRHTVWLVRLGLYETSEIIRSRNIANGVFTDEIELLRRLASLLTDINK